MADSSFKLELSWQSPWGSEKREGRALLPQGGGEGGGGGGSGGGEVGGGDSHGGRSSRYGLEELTNTKKRVRPRRAVASRAGSELRRTVEKERETDAGLGEGSMDSTAQALQRSNQTSSEEEEEAGSSLFHRILEQRQLRNPDEEMVSSAYSEGSRSDGDLIGWTGVCASVDCYSM